MIRGEKSSRLYSLCLIDFDALVHENWITENMGISLLNNFIEKQCMTLFCGTEIYLSPEILLRYSFSRELLFKVT